MARKKRRGRPVGSKNKTSKRSGKKRGRKTAAKRLNQIPLPILEKRLLKLARIVKQRQ